eukprot:scaffold440_cov277-Ochromonas_danica.AAC.31
MEANYVKLQALIFELTEKVSHLEEVSQSRSLAAEYPTGTGFDSGDTAWMLTSTALVLFMTLPGLFLYYGGMARTKNVISIIMQTVSTAALITFLWLAFGYSLSFAPAQGYEPRACIFGNRDRFWFTDMKLRTYHQLAPTIPEAVFCTYQLGFAIITACLMIGSFADRMKFTSMLLLMSLWHLTVYCPTAHSMWHPNGFLYHAGVLDYAGGNVVHITSGISGLVIAIYLGPRKGFGKDRFDPHNILFTAVGACMLWVGWFGFNAGSALASNDRAAMAMLITQIGCSMAALTWMINEWIVMGHPTVQGLVSGAIAGLVAITPAAGYVDHTGAFIIGLVAGPICYGGVQLKHWFGYDDALDGFGVHGVGGITGGLLLGFFATDKITGHDNGVFYSDTHNGGMQWAHQLYAIVVTVGWSIFMTTIIVYVVDMILGLRVSAEQEEEGLDISLHNETLTPGALAINNKGNDDGKSYDVVIEEPQEVA